MILDLMLYAALAIVVAVGCGILFVAGWLIHCVLSEWTCEENRPK